MINEEQPDLSKYSKAYSENSFFDKILNTAKKAGITVIYAGLLLFYTLQKPSTPGWAKATIIGSLGYFISPIDVIPDIIPVVGYSDDLGALILAIVAVAMFVDNETKQKAREKLKVWFGEYDDSLLAVIDKNINHDK